MSLLIVDGHGVVKSCTESLALKIGSQPEEMVGRPIWSLLPGWNPFAQASGAPKLRLAAQHLNMPVHLSCAPLHLADETFFVLEVHGLSRAARSRPPEATMVTDRGGEIRHVNPAYEAMTGFRSAQLAGWTPAMVKSGAHDHRTYRKLWDTILDGRVYRGVLINRRKNGELYREQKVIRPVLDARGRPSLFLSSGRDVTAQAREVEALTEGFAAL